MNSIRPLGGEYLNFKSFNGELMEFISEINYLMRRGIVNYNDEIIL